MLFVWCTWCLVWCIWHTFITKDVQISLNKLCWKQSLLRFLWKKVHRLEKSTPPPVVRWWTNIRYALMLIKFSAIFSSLWNFISLKIACCNERLIFQTNFSLLKGWSQLFTFAHAIYSCYQVLWLWLNYLCFTCFLPSDCFVLAAFARSLFWCCHLRFYRFDGCLPRLSIDYCP